MRVSQKMPLYFFHHGAKKSKMTKNSNQGRGGGGAAGPPPLEAILVIFGRKALIFFCLKALWKKKWKWHHFCAHAQWWSPWRRKKCRKKAPHSIEFNFFISCDRQKRSQNERRRADLQTLPKIFQFLPGDLVMIFQSLVMILPRFFDFERP